MNIPKIFSRLRGERTVKLPMVVGTQIIEVPVKAPNDRVYAKLLRAKKITEDTGMPIDGWVTAKKRTWYSDPNGNETAPVTGERGYYGAWEIVDDMVPNLLTTGGRDDFIDKCYIHNGQGTAAGNYIGLSNDATAPAAGDTSLALEITANGLARAQATTRTHTTGNNDWSLQYTWTATGSQSAQKAGLFTQTGPPVAGVMSHENTFSSVSLLTNDQLQLTWAGTLG